MKLRTVLANETRPCRRTRDFTRSSRVPLSLSLSLSLFLSEASLSRGKTGLVYKSELNSHFFLEISPRAPRATFRILPAGEFTKADANLIAFRLNRTAPDLLDSRDPIRSVPSTHRRKRHAGLPGKQQGEGK